MDYVSRAKALLQRPVRQAVLVIVPLASAVSAHATVMATPMLPAGGLSCSINPGTGSTNCTSSAGDSQLGVGPDGLAGVKFYTTGALLIVTPSGGSGQMSLSTTGGPAAFSGTIPLGYNFTLTGPVTAWSLLYKISQDSAGTFSTTVSGSGAGVESGTASLSGVTLNSSGAIQVLLTFNVSATGSTTITIPQNSIDVNSVSGVPEPSSLALTAIGIALAGGWRLRRRRKGFVVFRSAKDQSE